MSTADQVLVTDWDGLGTATTFHTSPGNQTVFFTSALNGYIFYSSLTGVDDANVQLIITKNGGKTWADPIVVLAADGEGSEQAAWADWDTPGDSGTLIHVCLMDTETGNNHKYRNFNTADDSLGTTRNAHASADGASFANNITVSITKAIGGNLIIAGWNRSGTPSSFAFTARSTDGGDTWTSRAFFPEADANDHMRLMPGNEADDQDVYAVFEDDSATELTLFHYDDSADSWAETATIDSDVDINSTNYGSLLPVCTSNITKHSFICTPTRTSVDEVRIWEVTDATTTALLANIRSYDSLEIREEASMSIVQETDDLHVIYVRFVDGLDADPPGLHPGEFGGYWLGRGGYIDGKVAPNDIRVMVDDRYDIQPQWFSLPRTIKGSEPLYAAFAFTSDNQFPPVSHANTLFGRSIPLTAQSQGLPQIFLAS